MGKIFLINLTCTVVLAAVLSFFGVWATRIGYWDGGLILCSIGVACIVVVEVIKMTEALKIATLSRKAFHNLVVKSFREELALHIVFMRASMLAHGVCAYFFLSYLKEQDIITCMPWQDGFFKGNVPNALLAMLFFFLLRAVAQLWFVGKLLKKGNYFFI